MERISGARLVMLANAAAEGLASAVAHLPRNGADWLVPNRVASQQQATRMVRTKPPRGGKPPYSGKREAARAAKRIATGRGL